MSAINTETPRRVWMDPGDGTLVPVELIGASLWPGCWRVRDEQGGVHHTDRIVDERGEPLRRVRVSR